MSVLGRASVVLAFLGLIGCGNGGGSGAGEASPSGAPAVPGGAGATVASPASWNGPAWAALFAGAPRVRTAGDFMVDE